MTFCRVADGDREDTGPNGGHNGRMPSQYAEIAFHAGHVDLIDFAGEGELFG